MTPSTSTWRIGWIHIQNPDILEQYWNKITIKNSVNTKPVDPCTSDILDLVGVYLQFFVLLFLNGVSLKCL